MGVLIILKNQKGQALVEFSIAIVILFLFIFGLISTTLWGTASFLAQEIAHEVAREYAVSNDMNRAISTGQSYMNRWGYIFIDPQSIQITVSREGNKATALIHVEPRIQKLFVFKMHRISKYSQATFEHYIRESGQYVQ